MSFEKSAWSPRIKQQIKHQERVPGRVFIGGRGVDRLSKRSRFRVRRSTRPIRIKPAKSRVATVVIVWNQRLLSWIRNGENAAAATQHREFEWVYLLYYIILLFCRVYAFLLSWWRRKLMKKKVGELIKDKHCRCWTSRHFHFDFLFFLIMVDKYRCCLLRGRWLLADFFFSTES